MELVHFYGYLCIHQQAFESMKAFLVADTLMRYPDRNFPFQKLSKNFSQCHQMRFYMFTLIIVFLSILSCTETQRVLQWRHYIKEYLLTFHDMKGTDNVKYYRFFLSPHEAGVFGGG